MVLLNHWKSQGYSAILAYPSSRQPRSIPVFLVQRGSRSQSNQPNNLLDFLSNLLLPFQLDPLYHLAWTWAWRWPIPVLGLMLVSQLYTLHFPYYFTFYLPFPYYFIVCVPFLTCISDTALAFCYFTVYLLSSVILFSTFILCPFWTFRILAL